LSVLEKSDLLNS